MKPAVQDLLARVRRLEGLAMATYVKLGCRFQHDRELAAFWMSMARHEAAHVGALELLSVLVDETSMPPALPDVGDRLSAAVSVIERIHAEADRVTEVAEAFALAVELESVEVEDVVFELFGALADSAQRDQAEQMLVHDLSDLSLMIEKYANDEELLERADALVERHVGRRAARRSLQRA